MDKQQDILIIFMDSQYLYDFSQDALINGNQYIYYNLKTLNAFLKDRNFLPLTRYNFKKVLLHFTYELDDMRKWLIVVSKLYKIFSKLLPGSLSKKDIIISMNLRQKINKKMYLLYTDLDYLVGDISFVFKGNSIDIIKTLENASIISA